MGYPYSMRAPDGPILGLVALQTDQTIEGDLRRMFPIEAEFYVSRVPSGAEVSSDMLAEMEGHLGQAAALLPPQVGYDVVGYGCTSGTAQIGADAIARQVCSGARARAVTEPVSALVAACRSLSIRRLAILSPYVSEVSARLRMVLQAEGVETPVFGSFDEAEEARVVRIDEASIVAAMRDLMAGADVDGCFLSCTNLRTLGVVAPLEAEFDIPVLSSNLVLGWHMAALAGLDLAPDAPGRLVRDARLPQP
ncbi:MAG: Asp/Glu racemase [Aestuariivita sp.]|uniref:maleate cis-trans isomerase family protein n=1 Tax=Aestuariivita sp. TaxID=1872407 RepID=UPI003BAF9D25